VENLSDWHNGNILFLFLHGWFQVLDSPKWMIRIRQWDHSPGWELHFAVPDAVAFQHQVLFELAHRKLESGYCPRLSRYWRDYQPSLN
jgi:hypothetical protein